VPRKNGRLDGLAGSMVEYVKVSNLITKNKSSSYKDSKTPAKRVRAGCGCCGEFGHNSRTCKEETEDLDNSDTSKQYYTITYSTVICCGVALCRCACAALVLLGGPLVGEPR
jgi:hypothetical protein